MYRKKKPGAPKRPTSMKAIQHLAVKALLVNQILMPPQQQFPLSNFRKPTYNNINMRRNNVPSNRRSVVHQYPILPRLNNKKNNYIKSNLLKKTVKGNSIIYFI